MPILIFLVGAAGGALIAHKAPEPTRKALAFLDDTGLTALLLASARNELPTDDCPSMLNSQANPTDHE